MVHPFSNETPLEDEDFPLIDEAFDPEISYSRAADSQYNVLGLEDGALWDQPPPESLNPCSPRRLWVTAVAAIVVLTLIAGTISTNGLLGVRSYAPTSHRG